MAWARSVTRFLLASLAVLALLEVGLRAAAALRDRVPPTPDESLEDEWKWARRHLEVGHPTLPSHFVFDPLLGWRNEPDLRTESFSTNSAGMRGSREFPLERTPGRRRLVVVGDSYTFGQGVRDPETFVEVLGERLPDWELLNLAVPGYGTDQQVLTFEIHGRAYRPDVVLLGFFVRDYSRNGKWFRGYAKPMFVPDGAGLRLTHSPVPSPDELYGAYAGGQRRIGAGVHSHLAGSLRKVVQRLRDRSIGESSPRWQILSRLMERFRDGVRAVGAEPVWLVIPYRDTIGGDESRYESLERLSAQRCAELAMICVSVADRFVRHHRDHPDDRIYFERNGGRGHMAPLGHRLVADELYRALAEAGAVGSPESDRPARPDRL